MKKDENHVWSVFNIYLFLIWGFINEKKLLRTLRFFLAHFPHKIYGPCVLGWRRHFGGYSIPTVVFLRFERRKVYQILGNYIRLEFSITGLTEMCRAIMEKCQEMKNPELNIPSRGGSTLKPNKSSPILPRLFHTRMMAIGFLEYNNIDGILTVMKIFQDFGCFFPVFWLILIKLVF